MKTDKNYKMSKGTKTFMSFILNQHDRGIFKNLMIQAENHYEVDRKKKSIKIVDIDE